MFGVMFMILVVKKDLPRFSNSHALLQGPPSVAPVAGTAATTAATTEATTAAGMEAASTATVAVSSWRQWPASRPFPCQLIFVKLPKCASSTVGGIARRVAAHHGIPGSRKMHRLTAVFNTSKCHLRANHISASLAQFAKRDKSRSFMFSFVREPVSRARSELNWRIRRWLLGSGESPTWTPQELIDRGLQFPTQVGYLNLTSLESNPQDALSLLLDYDFLGVVERMDESLVVLRLLLGLDPGDLLYVSAKVAWTGVVIKHGQEVRVPQYEQVDPNGEVDAHFRSPDWVREHAADEVLYTGVNRKLNATIQALGPEFDAAMATHQRLMARARAECKPVFRAVSAVNPNLTQTATSKADCYWRDNGCAKSCLNRIASELAP